ncbi:penicillin-binding transpeptidase domain-containing protein [Thermovibrio sp.]
MNLGRKKYLLYPLLAFVLFISFALLINQTFGKGERSSSLKAENAVEEIPKEPEIVKLLSNDFSLQYSLFKKAEVENGRYVYTYGRYKLFFTVDPAFQRAVEKDFKTYKVKYGAYVAVEPKTGKVLAVVSSLSYPDLAAKRSYPTASTFKIITAAAALDSGLATPKTRLLCGGTGDSCSPKVWLTSPFKMEREFATSFATSANPFFGNLGRLLGKELLLNYAYRFGFNNHAFNFPWGIVREPLDGYEIALLAAGLGDSTTSPLHMAFISQTIANGGVMMKPLLVDRVLDLKTGKVYSFNPEPFRRVVSPKTAAEIMKMMELTVKVGTVSRRRLFRELLRKYPSVVIGGKSGTLTENSYPEGRCEWFTGFLKYKDREIAFSSVAVNNWLYYISGYEISAVAGKSFVKLLKKSSGGVKCASSAK